MQADKLLKQVMELRAHYQAGLEKADQILAGLTAKPKKTKVDAKVIAAAKAKRKAHLINK